MAQFETPDFSELETIRALQTRVAFICACCNHYHRAARAGKEGCDPMMRGECGSPCSDLPFPEYRGPLSRSDVGAHCFLCGRLAEYQLIVVHGGTECPTKFALCSEDWDVAHKMVSRFRDKEGTNDVNRWKILDRSDPSRGIFKPSNGSSGH